MGLLSKLFSLFADTGLPASSPSSQRIPEPEPRAITTSPTPGSTFTVTYAGPGYDVSEAEVAPRIAQYSYVLTSPVRDKPQTPWFTLEKHEKNREKRSPQAYSWLEHFMPAEVARCEAIHLAARRGPGDTKPILVALRALIREKRKAKVPHPELVQALYGMALWTEFAKGLRFEYVWPNTLCDYIDADELRSAPQDFHKLGHLEIEPLGKTDVKWLTEAFGEPAEHRDVAEAWEQLRLNTIARYCWSEMRDALKYRQTTGFIERDMQVWLAERLKFSLGMEKENQARAAATLERYAERDARLKEIEGIWNVTKSEFVVADLETTGLDPMTADVLEFAALVVHPSGQVLSEYSALVKVGNVPVEITTLTGVANDDVQREGRPLAEVFAGFIAAVGNRPLFFHNAPFDEGFLKKACAQTRLQLKNPVYDTLVMSRAAWPGMQSHKLSTLAKIIDGAPSPNHRALGDAKTALAVLLAARKVAGED